MISAIPIIAQYRKGKRRLTLTYDRGFSVANVKEHFPRGTAVKLWGSPEINLLELVESKVQYCSLQLRLDSRQVL